jgi:glycosyltransferase involved in cell wall biosynthesis
MLERSRTEATARIKVLHLIETLGSGGAERLLVTNLKYLDSSEFESEVVTVFDSNNYWKESIEQLGIPVRTLRCKGLKNIAFGVRHLKRLIRESKPDLIHTHLWAANVIGRFAGRLTGVPVVSSVHNPEYEPETLIDSTGVNRSKLFAARQMDKWTAAFGCTRMIAVSEYVSDRAVARLAFPRERIDVIYNPIDSSGGTQITQKGLVRDELGLARDALIALNVGRLTPQKGFIYAVRAMPTIIKAFPAAQLLSVGAQPDQPYLKAVRDEIERLGLERSVNLVGEKRNVGDYLNAADIFVFPSLFEGLGIALAEAMAAGLPSVVSDIPPLTEFVVNGENGILIEGRKPSAISKAIVELLQSSEVRSSLGSAASATALELFSPQSAVRELAETYRGSVSSVR